MNRYFGHHTLEGPWHALLPRYLFLGEQVAGRRVLDLSCGTGLGASLLMELGATRVDAIDARHGMIDVARIKHAKQGLEFHVMGREALGFDAETFDLIVALDLVGPITDPQVLDEIVRVLRPGGAYICAVERTTVRGMESLLVEGGADEAPTRVRVPQIGELARVFRHVVTITQRPRYSFIFDEARAPEAIRADADDAALDNTPDDEARAADASPRPHMVDVRLAQEEERLAGVELWFCANAADAAPTPREIVLPYYHLVDRLSASIDERDELEPISRPELRVPPQLIAGFDESVPTRTRLRPLEATAPPALPWHAEFDAQLGELDALRRRLRADFEYMLARGHAQLDRRDEALELSLELEPLRRERDRLRAELDAALIQLDATRRAHQHTAAQLERTRDLLEDLRTTMPGWDEQEDFVQPAMPDRLASEEFPAEE